MLRSCPLSMVMLSVCRSSCEPQPAPLCVMLQCFKRLLRPVSSQRTLSALYSLCVSIVFSQHVRGRCSIFTLCVCVCEKEQDMAVRQRWWAVNCCYLNQTLLDPLFFLSPLWENKRQKQNWPSMKVYVSKSHTNMLRVHAVPAGCARQVWL